MLLRALLAFQESGFQRNRVTEELLAGIDMLGEKDRANLHNWLDTFRNPSLYQREVTAEGERLAERVKLMVEEYPDLGLGGQGDDTVPARITEGEVRDSALETGASAGAPFGSAGSFLALAVARSVGSWREVGMLEGVVEEERSESRLVGAALVLIDEALEEGRRYRVLGACDLSCFDMDLVVHGGSAVHVDRRAEADYPSVEFTATGGADVSVEVLISDCRSSECGYAISVMEEVSAVE